MTDHDSSVLNAEPGVPAAPSVEGKARDIKCPHCGEQLRMEISAKTAPESHVKFALSPSPGEFLSAENVGGAIADMAKLLKAIGRDLKVPTEVLLEKLGIDEAGTVTADLLIARFHDHHHSARSRKRRRAVPQPEPASRPTSPNTDESK